MVTKLILVFGLLASVLGFDPPASITGKWKIDKVEMRGVQPKVTAKQRQEMDARMKKMFINNVFDFQENHRVYMTPGLPSMPKNLQWSYDSSSGLVKVSEVNDLNSRIIEFTVSEKGGNVIFSITDVPMILTVRKL